MSVKDVLTYIGIGAGAVITILTIAASTYVPKESFSLHEKTDKDRMGYIIRELNMIHVRLESIDNKLDRKIDK